MDMFSRQPQLDQILATYQKNEDYLRSCVKILREWLEQQPHLPSALLSDNYLEISLIQNKLSIERTKGKIDYYCSMKSMNRYQCFFKKQLFVPSKAAILYLPFPKLTDDNDRIIYVRMADEDNYEMIDEFRHHLIYCELASRYDYHDSEIFIVDHTRTSSKFLTKIRPNVLMDGNQVTIKGHSKRIKEAHFISPIASKVFGFCKPFLTPKIISRVNFHDNIQDLSKIFPRKLLPRDFGGDLGSIAELTADFDKLMASKSDEILEYLDTKSNEELRVGGPVQDEMQGTFVKLNID